MSNEVQQVIVYRNPAEAAFWQSVQDGTMFPIICGIVVFFAAVILADKFVVRRVQWSRRAMATNVSLAVSVLLAIGVVKLMVDRL